MSELRSRPMIFSAPMVRSLLAGTKTMTRRLVRLPSWAQPVSEDNDFELDDDPPWPYGISRRTGCLFALPCPYGDVGDALWVREPWREAHPLAFQEGRIGRRLLDAGIPGPPSVDYLVAYRADGELRPLWYANGYPYRQFIPPDDLARESFPDGVENCWESPIFMPRKASRITLRITDIRVERLMNISETDAEAEGFRGHQSQESGPEVPLGEHHTIQRMGEYVSAAGAFLIYWDQLHGEGATLNNPLCWVISFSREMP